ncbi:MAG: T9SS type A sorting domain-containing protein [candidate division WOR-3 bacterium]
MSQAKRLGIVLLAVGMATAAQLTAPKVHTDDWESIFQLTTDLSIQYTGYWFQHTVATDTGLNVHVVWYDQRVSPQQVFYRRWDRSTQSWGPETQLSNSSAAVYRAAVACDYSGNVHVVWHTSTGTGRGLYYKRWDIETGNWSNDTLLIPGNGYQQEDASIACRPGGNEVHIVWRGRSAVLANYQVHHIEYIPNTGWSGVTQVTDYGYDHTAPCCAVDTNDNVHISWYGRDHGGSTNQVFCKSRIDGVWGSIEQVSNTNPDGNHYDCAIAVNIAGNNVHVVWEGYPASGSGTRVWHRCRQNGTWTDTDTLSNYAGVNYSPCIAVHRDGTVHVAWSGPTAASPSTRQIVYAGRYNGVWTVPEQLTERSGTNVLNPNIACDIADGIHIVWYDLASGNNDVYYLRGNVPDVAVSSIQQPSGRILPGAAVTPAAFFRNCGTIRSRSFTAFCHIEDPTGTRVHALSRPVIDLSPGTDSLVEFPEVNISGPAGVWTVRCSTAMSGDMKPANDTLSQQFIVKPDIDVAVTAIHQPYGTVDTGSPVLPQISYANHGASPAVFDAFIAIRNPQGSLVYSESITAVELAAGADTFLQFPLFNVGKDTGTWTVRCSTWAEYDTFSANNTLSGTFSVRARYLGWQEMTSLPAGAKPVKDGGWLAIVQPRGLVYAAKGNKTGEFYAFDPSNGTWTTLMSIPNGSEGKPPYKGATGVSDRNNYIYATKGNNTSGFWRYEISSGTWTQLADVPLGRSGKAVKGGTDMVFTMEGDTGYVYLLKGYKTDFFRFNTVTGVWDTTLPEAPTGMKAKWDKGSWLVRMREWPRDVIFAHKAKYHELWMFDVATHSWGSQPLASMPFVGMMGKSKKSKDGGCATFCDIYIFALKGGNTQEFWCYDPDDDRWFELETIPSIGSSNKRKRIKAGADIVTWDEDDNIILYALKGNKTNEFWRYDGVIDLIASPRPERSGTAAQPAGVARQQTGSTLITGRRLLMQSDGSGQTTVRIFDASGRAVLNRSVVFGRSGSPAYIDLSAVPAGIYLLRIETANGISARKLVVR